MDTTLFDRFYYITVIIKKISANKVTHNYKNLVKLTIFQHTKMSISQADVLEKLSGLDRPSNALYLTRVP